MTKQASGALFLALLIGVVTLPAYAGVYKWVDENGKVHYSEQPPQTGSHTQLRVQPAQSNPQPYSENPYVSQLRQMEVDKSERERIKGEQRRLETERQIREKTQERSDPQYWERERQRQADEKKARDDQIVAECKRNREVYCDKGVDRINSEAQWRNFEEDIARSRPRYR